MIKRQMNPAQLVIHLMSRDPSAGEDDGDKYEDRPLDESQADDDRPDDEKYPYDGDDQPIVPTEQSPVESGPKNLDDSESPEDGSSPADDAKEPEDGDTPSELAPADVDDDETPGDDREPSDDMSDPDESDEKPRKSSPEDEQAPSYKPLSQEDRPADESQPDDGKDSDGSPDEGDEEDREPVSESVIAPSDQAPDESSPTGDSSAGEDDGDKDEDRPLDVSHADDDRPDDEKSPYDGDDQPIVPTEQSPVKVVQRIWRIVSLQKMAPHQQMMTKNQKMVIHLASWHLLVLMMRLLVTTENHQMTCLIQTRVMRSQESQVLKMNKHLVMNHCPRKTDVLMNHSLMMVKIVMVLLTKEMKKTENLFLRV